MMLAMPPIASQRVSLRTPAGAPMAKKKSPRKILRSVLRLVRFFRPQIAHVANLSIAFHDRTRTGDVITRVTNDIDRMREIAVTALLPFVTYTLVLVAMIGVMFWMNRELALISLVAFPLFFIAMLRLTS